MASRRAGSTMTRQSLNPGFRSMSPAKLSARTGTPATAWDLRASGAMPTRQAGD